MNKRVILIVMDSFGIGEMDDSPEYGDFDVNTIRACMTSSKFKADRLAELGLYELDGVKDLDYVRKYKENHSVNVVGSGARIREMSKGKDTTIGHWEIAGLISERPLPTYPNGFPKEVLDEFTRRTGKEVLCNLPYSGTKVINDYGDEAIASGKLIVYTSADSVFQIAAHEDYVSCEELYEYCKIARDILQGEHGVGRVIARPFAGTSGNYTRTSHRHDFSLIPPKDTMLDVIKNAGMDVIAVGKIHDIFAGRGMTEFTYTSGNEDGINKTLEYMDKDFNGLMFVNLVDYDMLYGHRRDIDGYAEAVAYFDARVDEIIDKMRDDDVLMITADHGCDPSYMKTTDHTREHIPLLVYKKGMEPQNFGTRDTYADISATVLKYLGIENTLSGENILGL